MTVDGTRRVWYSFTLNHVARLRYDVLCYIRMMIEGLKFVRANDVRMAAINSYATLKQNYDILIATVYNISVMNYLWKKWLWIDKKTVTKWWHSNALERLHQPHRCNKFVTTQIGPHPNSRLIIGLSKAHLRFLLHAIAIFTWSMYLAIFICTQVYLHSDGAWISS